LDKNNNSHDIEYLNLINDHNYILNIREMTEFSMNVVEYIARYVIMQLRKKLINYDICISALTADSVEKII